MALLRLVFFKVVIGIVFNRPTTSRPT